MICYDMFLSLHFLVCYVMFPILVVFVDSVVKGVERSRHAHTLAKRQTGKRCNALNSEIVRNGTNGTECNA